MSPRELSEGLLREAPLLGHQDPVAEAVRRVLDSDLPALPVIGANGRLCGIFGEREFIGALFPAYLKEMGYAGFVPKSIDKVIEKNQSCARQPVSDHMNTEHIDVPRDFSDVQLAETFLHHRVLIIPVVEDKQVVGVITRSDFFHALGERFLEG